MTVASPSGRATLRDVAARAGVSTAVVSYVLNGRSNRRNPASPAVTERVRLAAAELGYLPNTNARSLKRRRTDRVCLTMDGPSTPWSDLLLETLEQAAEAKGYSVVLLPSRDRAGVVRTRSLLQQGFADGVLIPTDHQGDRWSPDDITALTASGTAVVVISDVMTAAAPAVYVRRTVQAATEEALTRLVGQGRRRIGVLAHHSDVDPAPSPRYAAYRAVLRRHRIRFDPGLVMVGAAEDRVAAYQATTTLIEQRHVDAIFSASDRGAVSGMSALRDLGVGVPDQVAVLGFGNIPEGTITRPPLSSVGQDLSRLSEMVDALFHQLGSGPPADPVELVIPSVISWRGSA